MKNTPFWQTLRQWSTCLHVVPLLLIVRFGRFWCVSNAATFIYLPLKDAIANIHILKMFVGSNCKNTPFCRNLKMFLFKICRNLKMFLLYLCSFLIILGYDCTSPRTLTLSRVRIPSLRMFQSWFVVSDLQCFCPPCSNRRAFAFGKRQPRGGLLRYRYRKVPLDLSFTPQYPQYRQQQTQCNQSL